MYIINLSYHRPIEEVEALTDAHLSWLKRYFDADVFIAAGRKDPRSGGVIMAKDIDRSRLDTILAEDPFVAVAHYEVIKVNISLTSEALKALAES
ncbi:YciI family protein [Erwinia sp. PK3-005]|uniref:YciI family protein n=1 Tax=Mixta hanseatica TaxID=2872648 RepID=A0ABY4R9H7_9GAMM|nr:YciI family protein [Mixta hanseatica]UQY43421.1 YciI family protein [Mixta hanseatica]